MIILRITSILRQASGLWETARQAYVDAEWQDKVLVGMQAKARIL